VQFSSFLEFAFSFPLRQNKKVMRKAILYILFILLLLAAGTLAYGFYNAKQIRNFAKNVQIIEMNNDFDGELQEVEKYFKETPNANEESIQQDSLNYKSRLDQLIVKTQTAKKEIEGLRTPPMAHSVSDDLRDYYRKAGLQAQEFEVLLNYINQMSGVTSVFGKMNDNSTLDDIKQLIEEAKNSSNSVSVDNLPADLKDKASQFSDAYKNYLAALEETVNEKNSNSEKLENTYADFSRADDQFFSAARQFSSRMENLSPLKNKIDSELPLLGGVYFSLR
jgi:hypothetical protein